MFLGSQKKRSQKEKCSEVIGHVRLSGEKGVWCSCVSALTERELLIHLRLLAWKLENLICD